MNSFKTLVSLAFLASTVRAAIWVTSPLQADVWQAGQSYDIEWVDDGSSPPLSSIGESTVGLYYGEMVLAQSLGSVDVSTTQSLSVSPNPSGGDGSYYLVFTSNGIDYKAWSATFSIPGGGSSGSSSAGGPSTVSTLSGSSTGSVTASGASTTVLSSGSLSGSSSTILSGSGSASLSGSGSASLSGSSSASLSGSSSTSITVTSSVTSTGTVTNVSTITTPSSTSTGTITSTGTSTTSSASATQSGAALRAGTSTSLAGGLFLVLAGALVF